LEELVAPELPIQLQGPLFYMAGVEEVVQIHVVPAAQVEVVPVEI
jgi:hypothetical protein